MSATCVFCGAVGPLSAEHVLPQWMRGEFTEVAPAGTRALSLAAHGERVERDAYSFVRPPYLSLKSPQDPFSRRAKVVCATCNNGWMSQLESAVKPILAQMARGRRVAMDPERQAVLARWLMKTVLMEYKAPATGPPHPAPLIAAENYRLFFADGAPSAGVLIVLAAMRPPREGPRTVFYDFALDQMRSGQGDTGYCATLRLGYLVGQVLRLPKGHYASLEEPPPHLEQLWPSSAALLWPPPAEIRHDQWESFVRLPDGGF